MTPLSHAQSAQEQSERSRPSEIRAGALKESKNDTTAAFILLSEKTVDVMDIANYAEMELSLAERKIDRFEKYYGIDDRSWLQKTWESDSMRVVLFCLGVYVGVQTVHSVN